MGRIKGWQKSEGQVEQQHSMLAQEGVIPIRYMIKKNERRQNPIEVGTLGMIRRSAREMTVKIGNRAITENINHQARIIMIRHAGNRG